MQLKSATTLANKTVKEFQKYKKENDLDAFFTANMSHSSRKDILERIGKFMEVPDWWSEGMSDPVQIQQLDVSNGEYQLSQTLE